MRMVWVSFSKEGIHRYPAALSDPRLADVSFLGHPHRHIFHFKVWIEVFSNDRCIEFIQFKRWLIGLFDECIKMDYKSCEMLSDEIADNIREEYPARRFRISVSEDNENGSEIDYEA